MKRPLFNSFADACRYCNIWDTEEPPAPGALIRVRTLDNPRKRNGFILGFMDGGALIGNWEGKDELEAVYSPHALERRLTHREIERRRQEALKAQRLMEEERRERYGNTARVVRDFFSDDLGAYPTSSMEAHGAARHPYLERKGVTVTETVYETTRELFSYFFGDNYQRLPEGRLLVLPLFAEGNLISMQLIDEAGNKYFLKNGMTKGAYWKATCEPVERVGEIKIHIAEGAATILSVLQNANLSGVFLSCMNAGNIKPVCEAVRRRYPEIPILLWADKDAPRDGSLYGVGITKAREAQLSVNNMDILAPPFTEADIEKFKKLTGSEKQPTDWNDFYTIRSAA